MRIETKPWGHEEIWAETARYAGKFLIISRGEMLSRQYHERKEETIFVLSGTLLLEIGQHPDIKQYYLSPGQSWHISPGTVHRFCATDDDVRLAEVSSPELDDVVRLEDKYAR